MGNWLDQRVDVAVPTKRTTSLAFAASLARLESPVAQLLSPLNAVPRVHGSRHTHTVSPNQSDRLGNPLTAWSPPSQRAR